MVVVLVMCGVVIEVLDSVLIVVGGVSVLVIIWLCCVVDSDVWMFVMIDEFGVVMLGFIMFRLLRFGLCDEKLEIIGVMMLEWL